MKALKKPPYAFVLEALEGTGAYTKPMFGCIGVYVDEKIVLLLREKKDVPEDNGVSIATVAEHHGSLRREFPAMRSLARFGPGPTGWQLLPADSDDFEESALHACELIKRRDHRIGKIPKGRRPAKRRKQ